MLWLDDMHPGVCSCERVQAGASINESMFGFAPEASCHMQLSSIMAYLSQVIPPLVLAVALGNLNLEHLILLGREAGQREQGESGVLVLTYAARKPTVVS